MFENQSCGRLRASGRYLVMTPKECIERIERDGGVMLHPLMGGLDPDIAWAGLRCFEREVLPRVAALP